MSVFYFPFYMENLLKAGRDWIFFTFVSPMMYFTQKRGKAAEGRNQFKCSVNPRRNGRL